MKNLFVYGTLTFPEIVTALTGKTFVSKPATLKDYYVAELPDHVFPGLIPESGAIAKGFLLLAVDEDSYGQIADWENPEFEPYPVTVDTKVGQEDAVVFVWTEQLDVFKQWDRANFEKIHLNRYIQKEIPEYLLTVDK